MDRPAFCWNRSGKQEQGAYPMAMVHSLLLPRCGRQYLRPFLSDSLSSDQAPRRHWADSYAFLDRNRPVHEDSPRGWNSTFSSGNHSLGIRRSGFARVHSARLDSPVDVLSGLLRLQSNLWRRGTRISPFRIADSV